MNSYSQVLLVTLKAAGKPFGYGRYQIRVELEDGQHAVYSFCYVLPHAAGYDFIWYLHTHTNPFVQG